MTTKNNLGGIIVRYVIIRIHGYQSTDQLLSELDLTLKERNVSPTTKFVAAMNLSPEEDNHTPFKLLSNDFEIQIVAEEAYNGSDIDTNLLILKKCGFKLNYEDIHAIEATVGGTFTFVQ